MFSYTGLTAGQVDILREEYAIYLVRSGRIVAGLNMNNVYTVAKAVAEVLAKSVKQHKSSIKKALRRLFISILRFSLAPILQF